MFYGLEDNKEKIYSFFYYPIDYSATTIGFLHMGIRWAVCLESSVQLVYFGRVIKGGTI